MMHLGVKTANATLILALSIGMLFMPVCSADSQVFKGKPDGVIPSTSDRVHNDKNQIIDKKNSISDLGLTLSIGKMYAPGTTDEYMKKHPDALSPIHPNKNQRELGSKTLVSGEMYAPGTTADYIKNNPDVLALDPTALPKTPGEIYAPGTTDEYIKNHPDALQPRTSDKNQPTLESDIATSGDMYAPGTDADYIKNNPDVIPLEPILPKPPEEMYAPGTTDEYMKKHPDVPALEPKVTIQATKSINVYAPGTPDKHIKDNPDAIVLKPKAVPAKNSSEIIKMPVNNCKDVDSKDEKDIKMQVGSDDKLSKGCDESIQKPRPELINQEN